MRIIHCDCEVTYTGRGDTTLPRSERVVILKKDGSVMIHSDEGIKPLNYMTLKQKIVDFVIFRIFTGKFCPPAEEKPSGGLFQFMRKTKKMRHQPEQEGIYLDDLDLNDMDPEVAALYIYQGKR